MCGIFGYVSTNPGAEKIILDGLEKLEYRGYDSAGIAVHGTNGIDLYRSIGKVAELVSLVNHSKEKGKVYTSGIGHTRWATHGTVNIENTHPHTDAKKSVFLVHNGIIENYRELLKEIKNTTFYGNTDTEVVAKLLASIQGGTFIERVEKLMTRLEGAYAMVFINQEDPTEMIGIKNGSPLVFAKSKNDTFFLASDVNCIASHTTNIIYLEDGDLVHIKDGNASIKHDGNLVNRSQEKIDKEQTKIDKGNYPHFMLKEIHEAPNVLVDVFRGRIQFQEGIITTDALRKLRDREYTRVEFIACGSSYHAGLLASYWIEELSDLDTGVTVASEFFSRPPRIDPTTLFVFISQSGETADSIDPLKYLKEYGASTFGIVNVAGSTIAHLTDDGLFTRVGVEVGVAATKSFIGQIGALLIVSLYFSIQSGADFRVYRNILDHIENLSLLAEEVLALSAEIKKISQNLAKFQHMLFLGRGSGVAVALEAALKFKEITYIHAEGLPLGELKHGSLALVDTNCPSVVFVPDDAYFSMNTSAISEIRARGGKICAISEQPIIEADWNIILPKTNPVFFAFLATIAGQLLAYYAAEALGREIDTPRNLAKSVTVR